MSRTEHIVEKKGEWRNDTMERKQEKSENSTEHQVREAWGYV